jgi:hypothetical protein
MAKMIDTEGEEIPADDDGCDLFDLTLWDDGIMSMSVPAFTTNSGEYSARGGVLDLSLRAVFEQYLACPDRVMSDDPISLSALLFEYAKKFEALPKLTKASREINREDTKDFEIEATMLSRRFSTTLNH